MNQSVGRDQALTGAQLLIVSELVGEAIAREDLPALEAAHRDFRAGMDELKSSFEQLTRASDQAVSAGQAGSADQCGVPHPGVKP
jgi:hypothetical protein